MILKFVNIHVVHFYKLSKAFLLKCVLRRAAVSVGCYMAAGKRKVTNNSVILKNVYIC